LEKTNEEIKVGSKIQYKNMKGAKKWIYQYNKQVI
jgi:hypothetical protein